MSIQFLLEAALRSLIMGTIILAALRIMRIAQVRAQRTAWLLALGGALAMPLLVDAQIGPRLLPEITLARAPDALESTPWIPREQSIEMPARPEVAAATSGEKNTRGERAHFPVLKILNQAAEVGYGLTAGVLLLRLCLGLGLAFRLRSAARRLRENAVIARFDPALDVRMSARVATPVTVGSSVLLPEDHAAWDEATLRVVLSHERAHVRQGDFFIHALAELHCALFWFNPFSWWLRRELSELGEALSDHAAVEHAANRASYAEILLAFATRGRPIAGVAMASLSSLTPRIERLLNEKHFERAFSGKQRLPLAAGVVILAMFAATATVKVHAVPNAASPEPAHAAADSPEAPPAPAVPPAPAATEPPAARHLRAAPAPSKPPLLNKASAAKRPTAPQPADTPEKSQEGREGVLGLHMGRSLISINDGKYLPPLSGDYIYFQHAGKIYLIQDATVIADAQGLLAPMQELGAKQVALGAEQALLGAQQRILTTRRLAKVDRVETKIDTETFKRDMARFRSQIEQMDLGDLNVKIEPQALAQVQSHIAEIQASASRLQAELGDHVRGFGEQQGELRDEQRKFAEAQRALAEQRRLLVEELSRQLQPIVEQAIREGKGTQLSEK